MRLLKKQWVYLIAILLALFVSTPNAKATQTSTMPIADSYVSSVNPDTNYGGEGVLCTYNFQDPLLGNHFYNTWLKFDLSQIPSEATINSIILRMHTFLVLATNKVGVFLSDDTTWKELEITWNNQPSLSSTTSLRTVDIASANQDYDFELTVALKGKSTVSVVLKTLQSTGLAQLVEFMSKEGISNRPVLIVDYSMPSTSIDPSVIVIVGIVIIVVVAVLGVAILKLRHREAVEKQAPTTPQLPPPPQ